MASFRLKHGCLTAVLLSIAFSCCRGQGGGAGGGAAVPGTQDAIQIVAQAALCFDNRSVINGCLQAMGINVTGNGANTSAARAAAANRSAASICSGPCFGQMTMMMGCLNGILGNIQGYSPGIMQGVQAVFQMACSNVNGQGGGGGGSGSTAGGGMTGGSGGATNVSSNGGSRVAVNSRSQPTSSADGPTGSIRGTCSTVLIIWAGTWLMLF